LRAEANVTRGLAMVDRAGDEHASAEGLSMMGEVLVAKRQIEQAVKVFQEAIDLSRKIGDRRAEANALTARGLALTASSHWAEAAESLDAGLALFRQIGTPASQAGVLYHLAVARAGLGQLDSALAAATEAVDIAETIRANVAAENSRVSFLASAHDYYSALIEIQMRMGLTEQAWRTAERARSRVLLEKVTSGALSDAERQLSYELNSESLKLWL